MFEIMSKKHPRIKDKQDWARDLTNYLGFAIKLMMI
jgi:hypothetical protein